MIIIIDLAGLLQGVGTVAYFRVAFSNDGTAKFAATLGLVSLNHGLITF